MYEIANYKLRVYLKKLYALNGNPPSLRLSFIISERANISCTSFITMSHIDKISIIISINQLQLPPTLSEKRFFNGSSEWSKVLPRTFCYLNQGKGSQTILSCEEP